MNVETLKKASELDKLLSDLTSNRSEIRAAIAGKAKNKASKNVVVAMYWPHLVFGYRVHCSHEIEDEMMEIAIKLLDKKISEVNKQISEL